MSDRAPRPGGGGSWVLALIGALLVAVVSIGLGVLLGHEEIRHRRKRASHGAPSAAQAAAG